MTYIRLIRLAFLTRSDPNTGSHHEIRGFPVGSLLRASEVTDNVAYQVRLVDQEEWGCPGLTRDWFVCISPLELLAEAAE